MKFPTNLHIIIPTSYYIIVRASICMYTHLPILASLLDHGVEEGENVDERFEGSVGTGGLFERGRGDLEVGVPQIQLHPIGRLSHHLQGFLRRICRV